MADSEVILMCLFFVDELVLLSVARYCEMILMCLFFFYGLFLLSVAKVIL